MLLPVDSLLYQSFFTTSSIHDRVIYQKKRKKVRSGLPCLIGSQSMVITQGNSFRQKGAKIIQKLSFLNYLFFHDQYVSHEFISTILYSIFEVSTLKSHTKLVQFRNLNRASCCLLLSISGQNPSLLLPRQWLRFSHIDQYFLLSSH